METRNQLKKMTAKKVKTKKKSVEHNLLNFAEKSSAIDVGFGVVDKNTTTFTGDLVHTFYLGRGNFIAFGETGTTTDTGTSGK